MDLVNFVFNFGFLSLRVWKFLPNLIFDFFANLDPNRVIFDFVDLSLSFLSKISIYQLSHLDSFFDLSEF